MVDQLGYFTPGFKAAVHDLVDTKHAMVEANADQKKLTLELPDLQKQAADAEAKVGSLRQELAKYEHPEETDFVALQNKMNDANAKPEEQIALAQAYVWTYPASPHQGDAQQYLQQVRKKLADQRQAEKDAEAARAAARAELAALGTWKGARPAAPAVISEYASTSAPDTMAPSAIGRASRGTGGREPPMREISSPGG